MPAIEDEAARMLLWFKAQLPPHRVDEWYLTAVPAPEPTVLEDTDSGDSHMSGFRFADPWRIEGYGRCSRCGDRFEVMKMGNALASGQDRIAKKAEEMKGWVLRDAERAGPCWGDVPRLSRSDVFAVLD